METELLFKSFYPQMTTGTPCFYSKVEEIVILYSKVTLHDVLQKIDGNSIVKEYTLEVFY